MATWNSSYENNPQGFKNPGEGAFHFRDLKQAIRERAEDEHVWGADETTVGVGSGGVHKEGSARVLVSDDGSATRESTERYTSTARVGRVQVNAEKLSILRTQDGTPLNELGAFSYKDQRAKKISIAVPTIDGSTGILVDASDPEETELLSIDYDELVDIYQDQEVNGIKKFTLSPQVPNFVEAAETVEEAWKNVVDTGTADEKLGAVNVAEAYSQTQMAKEHNIFDAEDTDNTTAATGDGLANPITGVAETTVNNISADEIFANKVYGAVYA